jgi:DNA primase
MIKQDLDDLRQNIPILDLAERLGLEIRRKQARCYNSEAHAHGDIKPSLGFDTKTNHYKCFTCGVGGSVIDLYMAIKGVDFKTAVNELSEGKLGGKFEYKPLPTPLPKKLSGEYSEVYQRLELFCAGRDKETTDYLTGPRRGLNEAILDRFNIFSIKDYQKTNQYLKDSFSLETLKASGLVNDKGNLIFYRHKVIIPFYDKGKVVFLQGRNLDGTHPKYLNLTGVEKPVFNLENLRKLKVGERVYICEGVFDAMRLSQEGYNAVAILGVTDFRPEEVDIFKPYEVVLALDNDEAGLTMSNEIAKLFTLQGKSVKQKILPEGIKDITDYFLSQQNDK